MGKLKEDFAAASEQQKMKYCRFFIEEASEAGKSERKIKEELVKIGAGEDMVEEVYSQIREELPTETEKAERAVRRIIEQSNNNFSVSVLRKILYKLSYMGFEEEIIGEIAENLRFEWGLEDIFS
ncbi:MAG: RecX family transcriptional regulator [Firmicutes bacterium]|nr:RecX family transcriptional regulator [Bacillota bacterium]